MVRSRRPNKRSSDRADTRPRAQAAKRRPSRTTTALPKPPPHNAPRGRSAPHLLAPAARPTTAPTPEPRLQGEVALRRGQGGLDTGKVDGRHGRGLVELLNDGQMYPACHPELVSRDLQHLILRP